MTAEWKINGTGEILTVTVTSGFESFVRMIEIGNKMTFIEWKG